MLPVRTFKIEFLRQAPNSEATNGAQFALAACFLDFSRNFTSRKFQKIPISWSANRELSYGNTFYSSPCHFRYGYKWQGVNRDKHKYKKINKEYGSLGNTAVQQFERCVVLLIQDKHQHPASAFRKNLNLFIHPLMWFIPEVRVVMSQGRRSSKDDSPMPRTMAPRARADTARTSGTGSNSEAFRPRQYSW